MTDAPSREEVERACSELDYEYEVLGQGSHPYADMLRALLAQRERDAEVKRVLTDALDELDAVAVDFGHHEAAARTMKDIVSRTWRQIYGE